MINTVRLRIGIVACCFIVSINGGFGQAAAAAKSPRDVSIFIGQAAYFFEEKLFDLNPLSELLIPHARIQAKVGSNNMLGVDFKHYFSVYRLEAVGDVYRRLFDLVALNYSYVIPRNKQLNILLSGGVTYAALYETTWEGTRKHIGGPNGCWEEVLFDTFDLRSMGLNIGAGLQWSVLNDRLNVFPNLDVHYLFNGKYIPNVGLLIGYNF